MGLDEGGESEHGEPEQGKADPIPRRRLALWWKAVKRWQGVYDSAGKYGHWEEIFKYSCLNLRSLLLS